MRLALALATVMAWAWLPGILVAATGPSPVLFASGLQFPQGPCFDRAGNLYVSNTTKGSIVKILPNGKVFAFAETNGAPNGLALHTNGSLYVADAGRRAILEVTDTGRVSVVADRYETSPLRGPDDLVFGAKGDLYFTDPVGSSLQTPVGRIYHMAPDRKVALFAAGFAFPKGIALSRGDKALYVAESGRNRIVKFTLNPDGSAGAMTELLKIPGDGTPDGIRLDQSGNLYVAQSGVGKVHVISPSGKLLRSLDAGGPNPTGLAFGGPDERSLFVTETRSNSVYRLPVETRGLQLFGQRDVRD